MANFFSNRSLLQAAELFTRLYVFIFLNIYGLSKIFGGQFHRRGQLSPEMASRAANDLSGFDLAWLFFGYSQEYILFIGITQVVGALLLLANRTKILGVLLLIPVLLNIIIVDICFDIPSGATSSAIIYLVLLLLMLWFNRERVTNIWRAVTGPNTNDSTLKTGVFLIACAMVVLLFLFELKVIRG